MDVNEFDPIHLFHNNPLPVAEPFPRNDSPVEQIPRNEEDAQVEDEEGLAQDALHLDDINKDCTGQKENPIPDVGVPSAKLKRKEFCNEDKIAAYNMLLQRSVNGKLRKHTISEVAEIFQVNIRSIQWLWKRGRESDNHNVSLCRVKNCGRKRVEFDFNKIRDIPLRDRTTLKSLATALGVSKSFLVSKLKFEELRRHSNTIKPTLTEANRIQRVRHCLSTVDPDSPPAGNSFSDMQNMVHIDEKWFQTTRKVQTYYFLADEDETVRIIKSTNFIPKIMFLVVVARPRFDCDGNCTFDGKIRVFPLVHEVAAIRSSSNRIAGTLKVKPIQRVDRQVIRQFMIEHILPAIKDKWPRDSLMQSIIIQQDNAKTHIHKDDLDFLAAVESVGLNIRLLCQPLNSLDLNVLDLGFFRAIQSLQEKKCANNLNQLVEVVKKSFLEFSEVKANNIFITLQSCMIEIMKIMGSNAYRIPHIKKEQLVRQGLLPSSLSCDPILLATAAVNLPLLPCKTVCFCTF